MMINITTIINYKKFEIKVELQTPIKYMEINDNVLSEW